MANFDALKTKLKNLADAVRLKSGETTTYTLDEMPNAIRSLNGNGPDTTDATLDSGDKLLAGYTAYANRVLYTGTLILNKYYTGTAEPSADLGNDGDIYLLK